MNPPGRLQAAVAEGRSLLAARGILASPLDADSRLRVRLAGDMPEFPLIIGLSPRQSAARRTTRQSWPQAKGFQPRPFGCEVGSQLRHNQTRWLCPIGGRLTI